MARPLRIEYPGVFYHVMNRGNAGQDLFRTKRDRESAQSLGAYFGGISGAGITMRYKCMSEKAAESRRLRGRLKKIRSLIANI
ncbi:MAG: hypothetical protein ISS59_05030 [Desulfobacteraceae bacterium]|nr:hypothetical protein [Desulfobacteraceae bacterium]